MEETVVLPVWIDPARLADAGEDAEQGIERLWADLARGETRRLDFEEAANGINLAEFFRTEGQEDRPAISAQLDKTEALQLQQCLAHGGAADAKTGYGLGLGETHTTFPFAAQ